MTKKTAPPRGRWVCETCGEVVTDPDYLYFTIHDLQSMDNWRLECPSNDDRHERYGYYIPVTDFIRDAEDWMSHMSDKSWFQAFRLWPALKKFHAGVDFAP